MAIDSLLEKVEINVKETDACTRKMEAKYTADVVDAAFKDAVKEVTAGYECGMSIVKFNDIKEGDVFECFVMEEIKR